VFIILRISEGYLGICKNFIPYVIEKGRKVYFNLSCLLVVIKSNIYFVVEMF